MDWNHYYIVLDSIHYVYFVESYQYDTFLVILAILLCDFGDVHFNPTIIALRYWLFMTPTSSGVFRAQQLDSSLPLLMQHYCGIQKMDSIISPYLCRTLIYWSYINITSLDIMHLETDEANSTPIIGIYSSLSLP